MQKTSDVTTSGVFLPFYAAAAEKPRAEEKNFLENIWAESVYTSAEVYRRYFVKAGQRVPKKLEIKGFVKVLKTLFLLSTYPCGKVENSFPQRDGKR